MTLGIDATHHSSNKYGFQYNITLLALSL